MWKIIWIRGRAQQHGPSTSLSDKRARSPRGEMATMVEGVEIDDVIARSIALKDEGNGLLASSRFATAAEKYSQAIEIHPTAIYYSNRAQALIKLESYGLAIQVRFRRRPFLFDFK